MGRVKIEIKKIENLQSRKVTYSKRRDGLLKKASELSVLCGSQIALVMFSPTGKVSQFCSEDSKIEDVIAHFAKIPPGERAKRKFETLEALNKALQKLPGKGGVDVQHGRLSGEGVQVQMENEELKAKLHKLTAENERLKQEELSLRDLLFDNIYVPQQELNPVIIPEPKEFVENKAEFSAVGEQNPSFPLQAALNTYPVAGTSADGGQLAEVNTRFDRDHNQSMPFHMRDSWTGLCAQPGTSTGIYAQLALSTDLCAQPGTSTGIYAQPALSTDLCAQPGTSTDIYAQPALSTDLCAQPGTLTSIYAQPALFTDLYAQPGTSIGICPQPATATGFYP